MLGKQFLFLKLFQPFFLCKRNRLCPSSFAAPCTFICICHGQTYLFLRTRCPGRCWPQRTPSLCVDISLRIMWWCFTIDLRRQLSRKTNHSLFVANRRLRWPRVGCYLATPRATLAAIKGKRDAEIASHEACLLLSQHNCQRYKSKE